MSDGMKSAWHRLRHPMQTATSAKRLLQASWNNKRLRRWGDRHFKQDPRYDPTAVERGFIDRAELHGSDAILLKRICRAYTASVAQEQFAPVIYKPTAWWDAQRSLYLGPVLRALSLHDLETLQTMYRNFFRDDCSTGLIPVQRMKNGYFSGAINDNHCRLFLIDALYRLDYWKVQTMSSHSLRDLDGPTVGNPFGVMIEETLIRTGSEYQHYCAQRISRVLREGAAATVAEIGGGFGGMAYYLLRDRPRTTYIGFDVPESIALTSYYLVKAFPQLNVVLYGEAELTADTISQADVVLMPIFTIADLATETVDISFSSHAMSDLSPEALAVYLKEIARVTQDHFFYIGNAASEKVVSDATRSLQRPFTLKDRRHSGWNRHVAPNADHVESLYGFEAAAYDM
jgi:putative sugar O-methyltransferase